MCSAKRSIRNLVRLVLSVCVAGVLGLSFPGCSSRGGAADLSPEAEAKAKENFKKRFGDFGETKGRKTSR
jgi:hypothetical protein